jgi:hypothetical protein
MSHLHMCDEGRTATLSLSLSLSLVTFDIPIFNQVKTLPAWSCGWVFFVQRHVAHLGYCYHYYYYYYYSSDKICLVTVFFVCTFSLFFSSAYFIIDLWNVKLACK